MAELNTGCLTCFQPTGLDFLTVRNVENTLIEEALRKHFWFTEADFERASICLSCWNQVVNFHQFYVSVEELYPSRAAPVIVKCKEDALVFPKEVQQAEADPKPTEGVDCLMVSQPDDLDLPVGDVKMYQGLRLVLTDCMAERLPDCSIEVSDNENEQMESSTAAQNPDDTDDTSDSEYLAVTKKRRLMEMKSNETCPMDDAPIEVVDTDDSGEKVELQESSNDNSEFEQGPAEDPSDENPDGSEPEIMVRESQVEEDYIKTHVKYTCEQCGHNSPTYSAFKMHSQNKHGTDKPFFMCCEAKYARKLYLLQDVKVQDETVKIRDQEVEKDDTTKDGYEQTVVEIDSSDELTFECDRCPRTLASELQLKQHMNDHSTWDAQIWKCTHCEKFMEGLKLGAHLLKCWSGANTCDICRLVLPSLVSVDAHNFQGHAPLTAETPNTPQSETLEEVEKPLLVDEPEASSSNMAGVEVSALDSSTVVKENIAEKAGEQAKENRIEEPAVASSDKQNVDASGLVSSAVMKENTDEIIVEMAHKELVKERAASLMAYIEPGLVLKENTVEMVVEQIKGEFSKLAAICTSTQACVETSGLGTTTLETDKTAKNTVEQVQAELVNKPVQSSNNVTQAETNRSESSSVVTTAESNKEDCDSEQSDDDQADEEDRDFSETTSRKRKSRSEDLKSSYVLQREKDDEYIRKHVKLNCNHCGVECPSFFELKEHSRLKHDNASVYVMCCGRKFIKKNLLLCHVQIVNNPAAFRCVECDKNYTGSDGLQRHYRTYHSKNSLKCDQCPKTFFTESLRKVHMQFHDEHKESKWKCAPCTKIFHSAYSLTRHINRLHPEAPKYFCGICSKEFRVETSLTEHKLKHRSIECPRCSLLLRDKESLINHARVMHPNAKLCTICIQIFSTEAALQTHMTEQHGERVSTRRSQAMDDDDDCEEEGQSETSVEKTTDVKGIVLDNDKNSGTETNNVESKESVSAEEPAPNGLISLMVKSETAVGESELAKEGLQRHNRTYHASKGFKCEYCPKLMFSEARRKEHMQVHAANNNEKYRCAPCNILFYGAYSLNRHIIRLHPEAPRYFCDICSKEYRVESFLTEHRLRHADIQCPRCSLLLRNFDSMIDHMRLMHPNAKLCKLCIKLFKTEAALQTHMTEQHGGRMNTRRSQAIDDDDDDSEEEDQSETSVDITNDVEEIVLDSENSGSEIITIESEESVSAEELAPNDLVSLIVKSETVVGENELL